ncbi:MAG: hypothetical protein IJP95_09640 [Bacteroidales bacterium]|nr:hypothetical protein [Bacteroidales bacterium]
MKKTVATPIVVIFLVGLIFAVSCKKEKNDVYATNDTFTPCHSYNGTDKGLYNPDSVAVSYSNGTVTVTHYNLTVNCGFTTVGSRITKSNDTIRVWEYGDGNANCVCETDHTFRINNIKGRWTLVLERCNPWFVQTYNFQ